ncbi:MAG TPA: OmpA family protein [Sphingobacteriaceae bacterium]
MTYRKLIVSTAFCLVTFLSPLNIFSDIVGKADRYYEKYDYKFAIEIYEKVMLKKPSLEVAQKLANCYRFINNTEGAERAYAKVLTFPDFDAVNYLYYADALKQNGKFREAREVYTLYGQRVPARAELAGKLAQGVETARMWAENPEAGVRVDNEQRLNSEYAEFSPVHFESGYVFVSDRWFTGAGKKRNKEMVYGWTGNPYLKLYTAAPEDDVTPALFPAPVNNDFHNGPAVFTAGNDTVFFTRADRGTARKARGISISMKSLYYSVRTGGKWSEPEKLPFNTSGSYSVQHPALSPDGRILYFASDMPGGMGGMDLYAARKEADGTWGTPVNCGPAVNTDQDDVFPCVGPDGTFFFASKGHVGMGGLDIFRAAGSFNDFTAVENLKSPFNSTRDDFGVLFFDEYSGFLSSNRKGGKGLDDIYRFTITPPATGDRLAQTFFAVDGQVIDKASGTPLEGMQVLLVNKASGAEQSARSDSNGRFRFDLEPETEYAVRANHERYFLRQEGQISTKGVPESTVFNVRFEVEPSQDQFLVRLNNIYYDFDKWNIRKDAFAELDRVVGFMVTTPDVRIELRAHTDSRGPAVYNQWLSQKRAESAMAYLKRNRIQSGRVSAKGLGESELLNRCADGTPCSVKEHQLNRRTEFKVIRVDPVLSYQPAPQASAR